jgi:hypothetical protein
MVLIIVDKMVLLLLLLVVDYKLSCISRGFYIKFILCKQNNPDVRLVIHKPGITYAILDIFV